MSRLHGELGFYASADGKAYRINCGALLPVFSTFPS